MRSITDAGVTGVRVELIDGDVIVAKRVVLAAGAWAGSAEWLPEEARPPVRPVKGQVVELRSRNGEPPARHILASERVYLVPRPDGRQGHKSMRPSASPGAPEFS